MPELPFRLIPALDLKGGRAVHAVAGQRDYYEPLQSILHPTPDPIALARALSDTLGTETLYIADLDAIAGSRPNFALYQQLVELGLDVWIDAGLRDVESLVPLLEIAPPSWTLVAGLETVKGPAALSAVLDHGGAERILFSLDLFDEQPRIFAGADWSTADSMGIALEAVHAGARQLLLIDLARVGTGRGLGTDGLMARIRGAAPGITLCVGGGISSIEEVLRLRVAGARGVLVSSALHDGRIGAHEIARLATVDRESQKIDGTDPFRRHPTLEM
jgi:phosphoribosylformimino-5-aminoimidazole carboxamide ribotide isomerase